VCCMVRLFQFNWFTIPSNHSAIWSLRDTAAQRSEQSVRDQCANLNHRIRNHPLNNVLGTGQCEMDTSTESPGRKSRRFRPSNDAQATTDASGGTLTVNVMDEGSTIGRNDSVCGQMGVKRIAGN
jgi:hypothetical protein